MAVVDGLKRTVATSTIGKKIVERAAKWEAGVATLPNLKDVKEEMKVIARGWKHHMRVKKKSSSPASSKLATSPGSSGNPNGREANGGGGQSTGGGKGRWGKKRTSAKDSFMSRIVGDRGRVDKQEGASRDEGVITPTEYEREGKRAGTGRKGKGRRGSHKYL
jgi:hypothetical protein